MVIGRIKTTELEIDIFLNRLLHSSNAIFYYDEEAKRTYLGVIDIEKFNSENIEKAINYTDKRIFSAKLTLKSKYQTKKKVYFHEKLFESLEPIVSAGQRGAGGGDRVTRMFRVSYFEDGDYHNLKKGELEIDIIKPRS